MSQCTRTQEGERRRNEILLDDFYADLRKSGIPAGEALKRRKQAEGFLNTYLLSGQGEQMEQGAVRLLPYLRTCRKGGTSCQEIREITESLRLFYHCMEDTGYLDAKSKNRLEKQCWFALHLGAGRGHVR
ncbi:MAG: hypothetical protein ACI4OJ_14595 [Lachnospiraceae bacterium]